MDRKQFMRDVYPSFWLSAREKKYGFLNYDRQLCDYLTATVKPRSTLLEVAVGTGYPIADFLQKAGYAVHGIDISPVLIDRCRALNPKIEARVGDAEHLEYEDEAFDCTYCFHSSWYFPDLGRVIAEMMRVTTPGGLVMFDIQNRDNPVISGDFDKRTAQVRPGLVPRMNLHVRNVAKVLLKRGNPNWHAVTYEVPTYPRDVYQHLGGGDLTVMGRREEDGALIELAGKGSFPEYQRLVFAISQSA